MNGNIVLTLIILLQLDPDYLARFYAAVPYAREIAAGKFEGGEGSVDGHGIDALISERAPLYGKVVMDPTRDGAR